MGKSIGIEDQLMVARGRGHVEEEKAVEGLQSFLSE